MMQQFHSQAYTQDIENLHSLSDSTLMFLAALLLIAMKELENIMLHEGGE